jgi:hypothetical protein
MSEQTDRLAALHRATRIPPAELVGQVDKGFGKPLDYLGHAAVTEILLEADPLWSWEPVAFDDTGAPLIVRDASGRPRALWIRLTVHGHTRLGVGTCDAKASDPYKELIGDALRNAAMRFGVALSLWAKEEWADASAAPEKAPAKEARPMSQGQLLAQAAARAGFVAKKDDDGDARKKVDEARRDVLEAVTGVRSSKEITKAQDVKKALEAFEAIAAKTLELAYDPEGHPVLRERVPA